MIMKIITLIIFLHPYVSFAQNLKGKHIKHQFFIDFYSFFLFVTGSPGLAKEREEEEQEKEKQNEAIRNDSLSAFISLHYPL